MQTSAIYAHVPFLEGSTRPQQSACCTCKMECAPDRRGRKLALSRTSPVPSWAACSAAARLPSTQRQLAHFQFPSIPVKNQNVLASALAGSMYRCRETAPHIGCQSFVSSVNVFGKQRCVLANALAGSMQRRCIAAPNRPSLYCIKSPHQAQCQTLTLHCSHLKATGIADITELNTLLVSLFILYRLVL